MAGYSYVCGESAVKLKNVQITKYKCVEDSTPWKVDQITTLVGKNEAGKSAILEALYKLNPVEEDARNFQPNDYPRRYALTDEGKEDSKVANVVTTEWSLDESDLELLREELPELEIKNDAIIKICKGYENVRFWEVPADEATIVKILVDSARFNAAERASITGEPATIRALDEALSQIEEPTQKHQTLQQKLNEKYPKKSAAMAAATVLLPNLPKFVYFKEYERLPGKVSIDDLVQKEQANQLTFELKIFQALLDLVNSSAKEIAETGHSEDLIMNLEAIGNRLTDEIFEYWSQNKHLKVDFRCDMGRPDDPAPFNAGYVFSTRIRNERHRASVNFDERSTGFIWFFSFLIWFSQMKANYADKLIVLLDEPGLTLHGKAQQDLLRYIREKLQPDYQVIYTTHSPFMLDIENIFSLRTVEDVVQEKKIDGKVEEKILGTKVGEKILSGDRDTILPLQGLLGYGITQTLFVGPYVVVVEGPSEWAFMNWFTRKLVADGRTGLDIRWAIAPAESASKVTSFITLFKGRGLKIAALLDYHNDQKKMVNNLKESKLLDDGHLLKTTEFVDQDEADVEDLIGWDLYAALVNGALSIPEANKLPATKPDDCEMRIVKEVEKRAQLLPPGVSEFDHFGVAQYLNQLSSDEIVTLPGLDAALDCFEALFTRLNGLIEVNARQVG